MSVIQADKDVLSKKRQALPEDVKAPLRDQIPKKLAKRLKEKNVGAMVQKIWNNGNADRSEWLQKQKVYLQDIDDFNSASADGPFEGSSSLKIPMPLIVAKTLHARFMQ